MHDSPRLQVQRKHLAVCGSLAEGTGVEWLDQENGHATKHLIRGAKHALPVSLIELVTDLTRGKRLGLHALHWHKQNGH